MEELMDWTKSQQILAELGTANSCLDFRAAVLLLGEFWGLG